MATNEGLADDRAGHTASVLDQQTASSRPVRTASFGPVTIAFDDRVLEPRPWTLLQSEWAAELAAGAPAGAVLELCAGAGQIGLVVAVATGRPLVQVDCSEAAAAFARANAASAGLAASVEVRCAPLESAVGDDEYFPLILADPPYLPSAGVGRFPDDPPLAVDGGPDGLDLVRACLTVAGRHLAADGFVLLQVAGPPQARAVVDVTAGPDAELAVLDVRVLGDDRAVVLLTGHP